MEGPKITITITKANGEQQVINADYFIGCVHEEGEPRDDYSTLGVGLASAKRTAQAKHHIDYLFREHAKHDPSILLAMMMYDERNTTNEVETFKMERVPEEEAT